MADRSTKDYAGRRYRHLKTGGEYTILCIVRVLPPTRASFLRVLTGYEKPIAARMEATPEPVALYQPLEVDQWLAISGDPNRHVLTLPMVGYRNDADETKVWLRPEPEFFDGRFAEIEAAS